MQLHRLEGFYWVARTGGYARAARAFPYPLTQPAVFQQVRKLENDLGVRLFERGDKAQVRLTTAGRHLYTFAAPFFEALPAVVRAIRGGAGVGELRIVAEALVLHQLLPDWVRRLQQRLPDLRIDVRELPALDPMPVRLGDADLAVAYFPNALPPGLEGRRVATLHAHLVMPASHPLAQRRNVSLADLADETFVTYNEGTVHHAMQMKALAVRRLTPRRVIAASSAEAILGLVAAGVGFSLVPSVAPSDVRRRGIVARPFSPARALFPVLAVWRTTTTPNAAVEAALATAPGSTAPRSARQG